MNLNWESTLRLAIDDCTSAIDLNPSYMYFLKRGDMFEWINQDENALNDYSQSILLEPNEIEPYKKRKSLFDKLGRINEAERDSKVIQILEM